MSQDDNSSVGNKVCGILCWLKYHKLVTSQESSAINWYIFNKLPWSPRNGDSSFQNQLANQKLREKLTTALGEKWLYIDLLIRCCIRVFVVKSLGEPLNKFAGNVIGNIWNDLKEKLVVEFTMDHEAKACLQKWLDISTYTRVSDKVRDCRKDFCENLADLIFMRPERIFQGVVLSPSFYQRSCRTKDGIPIGQKKLFNLDEADEGLVS